MNLKKIAGMCKNAGSFHVTNIVNDAGEVTDQWVILGPAAYRVDNMGLTANMLARFAGIKNRLPEEMILGQLMEECADLIQAAHKVIRSRQAINRPHGDCDYVAALEEEIADVMLCVAQLSCIDGDKIESWIISKEARWKQRLREEGKEC